MDAVYFLAHSPHGDEEIRYSLRSLHRHAPWLGKVWIVGDKPEFISRDKRIIEHVDYRELIALHGHPWKYPVRNFFLGTFLASLHPEISNEFLWLCDDFFLIGDLLPEVARRLRYAHDMARSPRPDAKSLRDPLSWRGALWHTGDVLASLGYTRYDAETHTPSWYLKRWVCDAFVAFREHVRETRLPGMLIQTAVLNHAHRHHGVPVLHRETEGLYCAWHRRPPAEEQVRQRIQGKVFLNCDDHSWPGPIRALLRERFPRPSPFER